MTDVRSLADSMRARARRVRLLVLLPVLLECSAPPADERFVAHAPPRDTFPPVSEVIGSHCGSLDCHGQPGRNLKVYSGNGLRLADVSGGSTTPEEHSATYDSLVAIDPEVLSTIAAEQGQNAERWIVISKGRGSEEHKGGVAMERGDPADVCILTWLAGGLDDVACTAAAEVLPPEAP